MVRPCRKYTVIWEFDLKIMGLCAMWSLWIGFGYHNLKKKISFNQIAEDFKKYFDIDCESIWGYKCMEEYFKPILSNGGLDVRSEIVNDGCIVYYTDIKAAIKKLYNLSDTRMLILEELNIEPEGYLDKLKKMRKDRYAECLVSNNWLLWGYGIVSGDDSLRNTGVRAINFH